ncbi:hypothetical protein D3C80_1167130 [compost metagenome]
MDDHVVADEAYACTTLDLAFDHTATGNLANLGDVEDFQDLGIAEEGFAAFRRQKTRHGCLNVIHQIVDDVVVADVEAVTLGDRTSLCIGADVEADDCGIRCLGERDIRLGDRAGARMDDTGTNFVGTKLVERRDDRFDRTLHVTLDDQREFLETGILQLAHHLLERTALAGLAGNRLVASKTLAILGDFAGTSFVFDDGEAVTGSRRAGKTEHFDRGCRTGFLDVVALVGDESTNTAPLIAGNDDLARLQRTLLDEHGRNRTTTAVELGFNDRTFGSTRRVGLQVENFGL